MQFTTTFVAIFLAFSGFAAAASSNAREDFKENSCLSQACRDQVDAGCPLGNINFELGGCDDPSF